MKALPHVTGFILILLLNTACAENTDPGAAEAAAESPAAVESPAAASPAPADSGAPAEPQKVSAGMTIPLDGTSLEAFDASLAKIKGDSTASEYLTLTNAIDYLLVYDLQAKRDRTKLAALLNGQTGEQIIQQVEDRKRPSKAKKKAAQQDAPGSQ